MPPSVARSQNRACPAAQRRQGSSPRTTQPMTGSTTTRRPSLLDHADHFVAQHRREGGEWRQDCAGMAGQQRHVGAADAGQRGTQADPVIAPRDGWVVSVQLQPGHPAAGQAGQAIAEQAQRPLVGGRRAEAQPQAARRSGHVVGASQSIGTRRTILGPTRSRISSRLWPVMVRPWFLRPMTARAGSGACRTSSATSSASSSVPHG